MSSAEKASAIMSQRMGDSGNHNDENFRTPIIDTAESSSMSSRCVGESAKETCETTEECDSVELTECDNFEEGLFVAALSSGDRSTPFWVGCIVGSTAKNKKTVGTKQKLVCVRWYQASGSAKDPFDAVYDPAKKGPLMGGQHGSNSFWESSIGLSEIITTFPKLTIEKRLDPETVTKIKEKLYK